MSISYHNQGKLLALIGDEVSQNGFYLQRGDEIYFYIICTTMFS